jgi:AcrR family transcriptional regulator
VLWGGGVVVARRVRTRAASTPPAAVVRGVSAGGGRSRERVAAIQRERLLAATVEAIEEHGYGGVTVTQVASRARVSRRTFYELFDSCESCRAVLVEEVIAIVEHELLMADLGGSGWRERVRGGLWTILCFLDREPALARVCVVQAVRGGPRVLERREQVLARLAAVLDEGRGEGPRGRECTPLVAEGLVAAALGIVNARLLRGAQQPLRGLLGELMGMIMLPYQGPAAARREQTRPAPPVSPAGSAAARGFARCLTVERDPMRGLPMRLTYRTARVLEAVAARPGISNRIVADEAGVADQGQISKLLARLERLGLTENTSAGGHAKGEPNAWELTPLGRDVAQRLGTGHHREVAA